ncbi:MAG: outer membrane beta-barrel protein [Terriglobales bacterium]|jgi:peptidoglycan-associated lipoprotein
MKKLASLKTAVFLLLALGFAAMAPGRAVAQSGPRVDVGVDYNYVRTNAPAGGCGCFAMNGGSGWVAFNFSRSLGIVGEIASQHASNISSSGADLTLTSYLAGPRFIWKRTRHFTPFAQLLLGGAHASGTLAPGSSGLPGSANAFAMTAGGGLDIRLTRHIALRAIEADYYLTRFDNGADDHQNNLRIAAGVIIRLGGGN